MATSSLVSIKDFSELILEKNIYFKIIKLTDCFYVWIGLEPVMSNLAVAMPTKCDSVPSATLLFGNKSELSPSSLAFRLAKKLDKQVLVSCSVPFDQRLSVLVEKKLSQELGKMLKD